MTEIDTMRAGIAVAGAFLAGLAVAWVVLREPPAVEPDAASARSAEGRLPSGPDEGQSARPREGPDAGRGRLGGAANAPGRGRFAGPALAGEDFRQALDEAFAIDDPRRQLTMLRQTLARASADEAYAMLALAATLPDDQAQQLRQAAIQQIALTDPAAAAREIDFLSSSEERTRLSRRIIADYASADPAAALEWARNQQPPIQGVEEAVLTRIGSEDPLRAIELMLESERSVSRSVSMARMVTAIMDAGSGNIEQLANSVLLLPDSGEAQQVLSSLTNSWASRNPGAALNWLVRQGTQCSGQSRQGQCAMITPQLFSDTAQHVGAQDPAMALLYADRVPATMRTDWVRASAAGFAREDPRAAAVWIGTLGNDPDYAPAAVVVAEHLARTDVQAAASLLDTVPAGTGVVGAVQAVALAWVESDPWSAATWVGRVDDERARTATLTNVIREWSQADLRAAGSWIYSYPQGVERDALINTAIDVGVGDGVLDGNLLSALSTDQAREQTVANAVQRMAGTGDLVTARRWLDLHVRSPETRARLELIFDN